ncbi:hypothetical protein M3936_19380 [Sutcliffiella horikoshii]|uniref:hypothetical protein n=1 Tax=Sutcliffiella horikoshii TaxID=79883 RepID=UPI00203C57A0|nr:hypothetical protein [Sutcliffiella horikoshii]MCM3619736.1 hypothetical protein [Sutcliffiella horikoshii]
MIIYFFGIVGAIGSGLLVYLGLSSRKERLHYRLRFKQALKEQQEQIIFKSEESKLETIFKDAGYPLGINAIKWHLFSYSLLVLLSLNYIIYPVLFKGDFSAFSILGIMALMFGISPNFPFSLTSFILKRWIEYKKAKKNAELFSLYDMLISEIQMMNSTRINAYNLLKGLKPYFSEINGELNRLLINWNSDKGPAHALEIFAKELNTPEAESLITVLKTFDENKRETILQSLRGMEDTFINSQIENYRRKRKLYVDLGKLPIKATHFLVLLNFVVVIVYMVSFIMSESRFSL